MVLFGGVMDRLGAPLDVKLEQRDRASVFRETPAAGRVVWLALMVGLAILLVLAAALPWVGRRALVEWLGL